MQPSHGLEERASINELVENYYVDETLTESYNRKLVMA